MTLTGQCPRHEEKNNGAIGTNPSQLIEVAFKVDSSQEEQRQTSACVLLAAPAKGALRQRRCAHRKEKDIGNSLVHGRKGPRDQIAPMKTKWSPESKAQRTSHE